ncbi:MAG TPA: hypothetical protein DCO77_11270 [Nitrospiraceae bacterium]|nr:hypothetical protein [Nitrospiraceae bacterium]
MADGLNEKIAALKGHWQRLSKREQVIASITLVVVLSALFFQFPYTMQKRSMHALRGKITAEEKGILDLTAQITELKGKAERIKNRTIPAIRGRKLSDQKSVVLFLEDVSSEARRLGVGLVAVHPSKEIDKEKYKEVSMSLDLKARYRDLAEYFKKLEQLSRVVSIRKIRIESCPDTASVCAAQIEAVTYMAK